jgi:3-methyladenine DNA glycosylase/8-oxoguanine DNA glycosylase
VSAETAALPRRRFEVALPVGMLRSLRVLVASAQDPTIRLRADGVVRTTRTPDGPGTVEILRTSERGFEARAWGAGAAWLLEQAPALVGAEDDLSGFDPRPHALVAKAHHRRPDLRMIRSGRVEDVLVPTILAQRVTSREAARSWTRLVRTWGRPAPGPHGLLLPPPAEQLAATPYWAYHRLGIERSRASRISAGCRHLHHLQAAVALPHEDALARLVAVPGIGIWTAAHLLRVAGGDPDVVEVGDYGVKDHVAWNLAGEPRATDERMLELLAPFRGHRGRVVRLLLSVGQRPPGFGPKPRVIPVDHL